MKLFTCLLIVLISVSIFSCKHQTGKNKVNKQLSNPTDFVKINTDSIVKEGYELYYLERASWVSTDLFQEKYVDFKNIRGYNGYITYRDGENIISTYWKIIDEENKIFETYKFNSHSDSSSVIIDNSVRVPNKIEKYLFYCRNKMSKIIIDTNIPFQTPDGCNFSFVYLRDSNLIRIVVLTGPKEPNIIPFGNDFEFKFDYSGKFLEGRPIHGAMINPDKPVKCPSYEPVTQSIDKDGKYDLCKHDHFASVPKFMTSTDICNFLLYGKGDYFAVFSKDYFSLFTKNDSPGLSIWTNEYFKEHFINK